MTDLSAWQELESEVYHPGQWLGFWVGTLFLLVGGIGFLTIGTVVPPGIPIWIAKLGTAVFASFGGAVLASALGGFLSSARVRHAASYVLPEVPQEPVIREGAVVHGRLTHELWEEAEGWQFRPAERLWRNDKLFLLGFGLPFMAFFSGLLAWTFHSDLDLASWPVAALCGVTVMVICFVPVLVLIGLIMHSSYRQLSRLSIPRDGSDLELDAPEEPNLETAGLAEGVKWAFLGETKRQRLTIPRDLVVAVQLCPWKLVMGERGGKTTWAVQGLLVLAASEETAYHRLPILLTGDFAGAARLMERLTRTLEVPYLFSADAAGWKTEELRASERPPLRAGGMLR